jgi:hypothetical protein
LSWHGLIGWPGRPPGSSHGEVPWSPVVAWPWRVEDETGERFGEYDGFPAEPEGYVATAGLDVTKGKAADGGGLLGVEQDEQSGDPVLGLDGVVVQQLPGLSRREHSYRHGPPKAGCGRDLHAYTERAVPKNGRSCRPGRGQAAIPCLGECVGRHIPWNDMPALPA